VLGVKHTGVAVMLVAFAAACSAHNATRTDVISAGQVDIQLPPGFTVTRHGVVAPAVAPPSASGGGELAAPASSTIPLDKQDPTTAFFQATSDFSSCLKGLGVTFIGAPDPHNPTSPANDPNYIKSLTTCAAQSHIVQALKDFQTSQNDMTPAQIKVENAQYLKWRTCMIGRGWQIPEPTPDAQGRLFSIGGSGGTGVQLTPPPGQSLFNSTDISNCASQVQQQSGGGS